MSHSFSRRDVVIGALLAAIGFCLYIPLLSKDYVVEGLFRALPIETHHLNDLLAGNYLLYGPLGFLFHSCLGYAGIHPLAFVSLQLMDCLIGAAGLTVFYLALRQLAADRREAFVWSLVLAVSLGYWLWSTEAENYIFSTFLLQLNFLALTDSIRRDSFQPLRLGLLQGLAVMGHIVNLLFVVVTVWTVIQTQPTAWKKPLRLYLSVVAIFVIGAYGGVVLFIKGFQHFSEAANWFCGSAGNMQGGLRLGGWPSIFKFGQWLRMTGQIFFSFAPHYPSPAPWPHARFFLWIARMLLLILLGAGCINAKVLWRKERVIVGACLLWVGTYAVIFSRWEPWTMVYRVSDLVPLCVLLFLSWRELKRRYPPMFILAPALVVSLALGNWGATMWPRSFASNNELLQQMRFIQSQTKPGDWVMGTGGKEEIYIPYFAGRNPIVVGHFYSDPASLRHLLNERLGRGEAIYASSQLQDDVAWKAIGSDYHLVPKARDAKGWTLYQVVGAPAPAAFRLPS